MTTPARTTSSTRPRHHPAVAQETLCRLRDRYRQAHDLFSRQELARLSLVRWLVQSGRLAGEEGGTMAAQRDPVSPW